MKIIDLNVKNLFLTLLTISMLSVSSVVKPGQVAPLPGDFISGEVLNADTLNSKLDDTAVEVNDNDNHILDNADDITSLGGRVTSNENDMPGIDYDRTTCGGIVIPPFPPPPCAIILPNSHITITSVAFVAPATGYVVVSADGYYSLAHTAGTASSVCVGITGSPTGTPCGGGIIIGPITVSQRRAAVPASAPGGTYQSGLHSQLVSSVTAGTNYTFYLRGFSPTAGTTYNKYGLIAYFVPNRM